MLQGTKGLLRLMAGTCAAVGATTLGIANQASAASCNYSGCSVTLYGHVYLENDWWGVSSDKASGFQSIYTNGSNNAWGSQVSWTAGNNQYGVKSYSGPYDGWNWGSSFNGGPFPKQLAGKSAAWNYINGYYATNGSQDSIWDSFYNYSSNPGGASPNMEIEVWLTASWHQSNPAYQANVDGWTWNVYGPGTGSWPVWCYVPLSFGGYEDFNLMDIADDIVNRGKCSQWLYMLSDDFGEEVYYTSGTSYFGASGFSAP